MAKKKVFTREVVSTELWTAFDASVAALRQLQGTSVVTESLRRLWLNVDELLKSLRKICLFDLGDRVKIRRYGSEELLCDVIAYIPNGDEFKVRVEVLYSKGKEFNYKPAAEVMDLDIEVFHDFEIVELKKEDLPLFAGMEFIGTKLSEMLKNGEVT